MAYQWQFAGYSGAGHFPMIIPDVATAGRVWAISDVAGVWKSEDNGETWLIKTKSMGRTNLGCMVQSEGNPLIMFAGAFGQPYATGIERTTDGGENWSHLTAGSSLYVFPRNAKSGRAIAIKRTDTSIGTMNVYFGVQSGNLYRTTDGGTTITLYASQIFGTRTDSNGNVIPNEVTALWINYAGTYLFAGSDASGLKRYQLSDGTVTQINLTGTNGLRNRDICEFIVGGTRYIAVAAGWRVAYSADNGATWAYTANITSDANQTISRVAAIMNTGGTTISDVRFAVSMRSINNDAGTSFYVSTNGGNSWTASGNSGVTFDAISSPAYVAARRITKSTTGLSYDPRNPNRLWSSDDWGIYVSEDHGSTWTEKVEKLGNAVGTDVVIAPDNSIIMCAMDNGAMRSTDGGATWTPLIPNSTPGQNYNQVSGHVWRIICLGTQAQWNAGAGVCMLTNYPWDGPNKNQILYCANMGGAQGNAGIWQVLGQSVTGITNVLLGWDHTSLGVGAGQLRGADVDSAGRVWLTLDGWNNGSIYGGVFRSGPNGAMPFTRVIANTPTGAYKAYHGIAVSPANPDIVVIATWNGGGIRRTANGTAPSPTWVAATNNFNFIFDIKANANGVFFYAGTTGVYRSTNGGANWTQIKSLAGTNGVQSDGICFHPTDPLMMFFSTTADYGIGPQKVFMTADCEAAVPVWVDVTGDLPDGTGFSRLAVRLNGNGDLNSTLGYLYGSRYAGTLWKMNMDPTVVPGAGVLSSTSVVPASLVQSDTGTVDVGFTTNNAWPSTGKLVITMPSLLGPWTFNQDGTTTASFISGGSGTLTVSIVGQVITLTRAAGAQIDASQAVVIRLTNIMNPSSIGSTGVFGLVTKDVADVTIDSDAAVAAVTIIASPSTHLPLTVEALTIEGLTLNG